MTLEMVANLIDCPISELKDIEEGKNKQPRSIYLYRLSKLLEIDYDEMLFYKCANYHREKQLKEIIKMRGLIPAVY